MQRRSDRKHIVVAARSYHDLPKYCIFFIVNVSFLMCCAVVVNFSLGCISLFDDAYFTIFSFVCQAVFCIFICYLFISVNMNAICDAQTSHSVQFA